METIMAAQIIINKSIFCAVLLPKSHLGESEIFSETLGEILELLGASFSPCLF